MRALALTSALLLLSACPAAIEPQPPPLDRFVFPTSAVHRAAPGGTEGVLYVASSNFDRTFDSGAISAVSLDALVADGRLPRFPAQPGFTEVPDLGLTADNQVHVASLTGVMDAYETGTGVRLFVPSRDEGSPLQTVEADAADPARLRCGGGASGRDCREGALSLVRVEGATDGVPRAPAPVAARVIPFGGSAEVWLTHAELVDTPEGSRRDPKSYLLHLSPDARQVTASDFYQVSDLNDRGGTHAVARLGRFVVTTGRRFSYSQRVEEGSPFFLLKIVDTLAAQPVAVSAGIESGQFSLASGVQARGVAYDEATQRLYVVTQLPDALLVFDVLGTDVNAPASVTPPFPRLNLVNFVPLPAGSSELELIPRAGRASLVAITATSENGLVVFYDDDVGQAVGQLRDVGDRPYDLTFQVRPNGTATGARLFVPAFGDGQVTVIDIPDLTRPGDARLVAKLGAPQP